MLKKRPDFKKHKKKILTVVEKNSVLIGNEVKRGIITRTQKGKDIDNKPFKAYSKAYKKTKEEKYGSVVNLTVGQNMLNGIRFKKHNGGLKFYFTTAQNDKAHGNQVKNGRKFFQLDRELRKKVGIIIKKNLF